jgi:outer membrane protein TolC
MVVAPLHGFDPLHPPSFDRNLLQGNLSLAYTLYDGGARGGRIRAAESREAAATVGERRAGMEVGFEVSAAYLEALTSGELLEAALRQRTALEAESERVRLFLSEGKVAQVDLLRIQAALSRAEAEEISVRTRRDLAMGRLARLTALGPEILEGLELAPVGIRRRGLPSLADAAAHARADSPELALAREAVEGAVAGVRVAEAAWYPRMEAGGSYIDYGTLDGGHQQEWLASLKVSYPLFTGGVRDGERELARAREREAAEGLRLAEMGLDEWVEEALAAVREARALAQALGLAVEQSQEVARIEALALEAGAGVQTDFLRAEAALFEARGALAQARHGEVLAWIRLARATGELTVDWLTEQMEELR